mmetsp:Transcript_81937/g.265460  ORF Transcript_81937/g.265460 Transcript_81937/m.265460 type:complete len:426 (-) Transcript_81937:1996-3273(-)
MEGRGRKHLLHGANHSSKLGAPNLRRRHVPARVALGGHREEREPCAGDGQDDLGGHRREHEGREEGGPGAEADGRQCPKPILLIGADGNADFVEIRLHALHCALFGRGRIEVLGPAVVPEHHKPLHGLREAAHRPGSPLDGALPQRRGSRLNGALQHGRRRQRRLQATFRRGGLLLSAHRRPLLQPPRLEAAELLHRLALVAHLRSVNASPRAELEGPNPDRQPQNREDGRRGQREGDKGRREQRRKDGRGALERQRTNVRLRPLRPGVRAGGRAAAAGHEEARRGELHRGDGHDEADLCQENCASHGDAPRKVARRQACRQEWQEPGAALENGRGQREATIHQLDGAVDIPLEPAMAPDREEAGDEGAEQERGCEEEDPLALRGDEAYEGRRRRKRGEREIRRQSSVGHDSSAEQSLGLGLGVQ